MNPPRPRPQPAAGTSWTIFKSGNTCTAAVKVTCPQGATCNPPPPQPYACPENVTQYPVVIVSDGTMCQTERAPMHCPPHVACNPPPPKVVPCPK